MSGCAYCKHWVMTDEYTGECEKIRDYISVNIVTGSEGGYVNSIETEPDFRCKGFEERDEDE